MALLFWLCVVNALWWGLLAFNVASNMNEAMHHYEATHIKKYLKRYEGYLIAYHRKRKWMAFWGILSLITGAAWWYFSQV